MYLFISNDGLTLEEEEEEEQKLIRIIIMELWRGFNWYDQI